MKHIKKLSLLVLTLGMAVGLPALAVDANINLTGKLVSSTCDATAGVSGGQVVDVALGAYAVSTFTTPGTETPAKPFALSLINCPASGGPTNATVTFTGSADGTNASYVAVTGGATGVAIKIMDAAPSGAGVLVPVNQESAQYALGTAATQTLNFTANYISTAATPGPGEANATLTANVAYY